ncbi:MAG: DUF4160 domain-containing protein [Dehalococcoidia bacterium]|nr:DUF4160 domain-containing protein [Dehalococcoidia bacterium]
MPAVLRIGPYRFYFYSQKGSEPPHIHVQRDRNKAKFWLNIVSLENSVRFSREEIAQLQRLIEENQDLRLRSWNEYFQD